MVDFSFNAVPSAAAAAFSITQQTNHLFLMFVVLIYQHFTGYLCGVTALMRLLHSAVHI